MRVVDPTRGNFDRHASRRPTPEGPVGWIRVATEAEATALHGGAAHRHAARRARVEEVKRRWALQFERAARQLLEEGTTQLVFDGWKVDARLVRFWRGDGVVEIDTRWTGGSGRSLSRLRRQSPGRGTEFLVRLLARAGSS